MNYIGSVNKETLEVKLGVVVKGLDWVSIPDGTTDITIKSLDDGIHFWDNLKGLNYNQSENGGTWNKPSSVGQFGYHDYIRENKVRKVKLPLQDLRDSSGKLDDAEIKPVKSDGGSSSYYFSKLPKNVIDEIVKTGGIEVKDIVRYCFDNDADCKDIIKALKRIRENLKGGGKEGIDAQYDLNKIKFFVNELDQYLQVVLGEEK